MKFTLTLAGLLTLALAVTGCASSIKASRTNNPPPAEAYSNFGRIEIRPAVLAPEFSEHHANQNALKRINANFFKRLGENQKKWNSRQDNGRTLVIEPVVTEIRYIATGARIFTGPLSGSSAVLIHMKATETGTGKLIDQPEFYQHSSAGAGFALGITDNLMLMRAGELMADYLIQNYDAATGGSTGATDESVSADTRPANEYRSAP